MADISVNFQAAFNAGIALGLSGLFVRIGTTGIPLDIAFLITFFMNPFSFFAALFGIYGLVYLQIALYKNEITFVVPLVSALSVATPIILAAIFLKEYVPAMKWFGLLLILIGTVGMTRDGKKSLLGAIAMKLRKR
ncbi:MAG: hypothetical protein JW789_04155 [Candidatus Aenigmarchaeota archaeon]|nr:hypothetical protein [Candidatus Aenigmarchaeota archaeon]